MHFAYNVVTRTHFSPCGDVEAPKMNVAETEFVRVLSRYEQGCVSWRMRFVKYRESKCWKYTE